MNGASTRAMPMKLRSRSDFVLLRVNRRMNFRTHLLVLKVEGTPEERSFFGYAKTISRDGMFIATINPKNVGEEFSIEFNPPVKKSPIRCCSTVIWRREYKPGLKRAPGMALKFIDLDESAREFIDSWILNQPNIM